MGDDPPYLSVGTEVSAKYKGAFCEAKVRKVVKNIKCKVMFKPGLGTALVSDDQIKGLLRVGAQVEARHPDKAQFFEATISKIQDCSQYTVVFDDGDITTLRRTALCLKSGRHFAESETLDQLPLTHPEHFGTPVLGGRRGGRRREDSSDEEGDEASESGQQESRSGIGNTSSSRRAEDREPDIGKIVCVEVGDKKKGKEPWFPGLIVSPTAQDAVSIRIKDEYLVRSFKDARYYTVPKKEATEFTREIAAKTEINSLRAAIEKAVQYLDKNELPAHWDREVLFDLDDSGSVNDKIGSDGESSDEETAEEKDHFVAQLYKFMDDSGTPINKAPTINGRDLDLYKLFRIVHKLGGFNRVSNQNGWKSVTQKMALNTSSTNLVKQAFKKYLHGFEEFYRKLGSSMNSPMDRNKSRGKPGRSLIRVRDKASSGPSTPRGDVEEEDKAAVKIEETPAEPTPVPVIKAPEEAPPVAASADESEEASTPAEEEETDETSSVSLPARKPRERSVPLRLLDAVKPPVVSVPKKVEPEESGGEDNDQAENESNSSQSTRSQRGARNRTVKDRTAEDESQEASRPARKRGKSKVDDKDDDDKASRSKIKEEPVATNGKDEPEKKPAKETEKKSKASGKESGSKAAKNKKSEEPSKQVVVDETSKKAEDEEKSGTEEPTPKRRGRKPKVLGDSEEEEGGRLPAHIDVQIGDKLKVYYGPMQDSKVTYEAKVCEIRNEGSTKLYMVHYTGWNTRYDEWVKRVRIAENLTWTPNRKRSKSAAGQNPRSNATSVPTGPSSGPSSNKVAVPAKRGRARGQDSSRSATPSSVTSTSSTGQRNANTASGEDNSNNSSNKHRPPSSKGGRRRSRRISEMSTASGDSSNSSSEEEEEEAPRIRKKPIPANNKKAIAAESEDSDPPAEAPVESERTTPKRRYQQRNPRNSVEGEQVASEVKQAPETSTSSEVVQAPSTPTAATSQTPVRRGRRRAVTAPEVASAESVAPKEETEDAESGKASPAKVSSESTQPAVDEPKGKDFDLKKIRSELKMPTDVSQVPSKVTVTSPLPPTQSHTPPSTTSPSTQESAPSRSRRGGDDDIYEFREPEPFEFEVRGKRESPFNEDRVHHHRILSPQQKKPGKEDEEDNPKATTQRSGSVERTKAGMTSPPRNSRSNSNATSLPLVPPPEERSVPIEPIQLPTSSPSPPPPPPVAQSEVASTAQSVIISPPHPVVERIPSPPPVEEIPKSTVAAVSVIQPPMSALPHVMPALSTLAAHSVPVKPTIKSAAAFVVEVKPEEEEEDDDDDSDDDDRMRPKRERRKTGGRKPALSREFIEDSDDDSPEDRPIKKESATKKDAVSKSADEKTTSSSESTPSETAEDTADDAQTPSTASRKLGSAIMSSSKVKTEDDLDESSLLCEETIPGSPVTHCAPPSADGSEAAVPAAPSTSRSTEMPFASAPSAAHLPRTRGLSGGPSSAGARSVNRKRGLRQALAMQRPGLRPVGNGGAGTSAVTENTPPTTPDGSLSSSSNSPQGDHGNLSPEHESSVKSERDFSENDQPMAPTGQPAPSNAASTSATPARTIGPRASATLATNPSFPTPHMKRKDDETSRSQEDESPVKRRRRGGGSDAATSSSRRGRGGMHGRSPRRTGSDSEDTPVDYLSTSSSTMGNNSGCVGLTSYQPKSTRYNFCTELDPEMDASQRITSLQEKLRELRQTYSALKARVVVIDRRRKKLKRKEKDSTTS